MQILEFVHGLKLYDVKPVRDHTVRFSFEQMLRLIGSNVRDGREYVSAMCGTTFDTVTVIDATLSRFVVHIKVLQIVVEID